MWLNKHKWCSLTEPSQTVWWRFLSLSEVLPSTGLSSPCFGLSTTRACQQPASKKDTKQIGLKKVLLHMTLFPRLSIFSTRIWSTTRKTQTTEGKTVPPYGLTLRQKLVHLKGKTRRHKLVVNVVKAVYFGEVQMFSLIKVDNNSTDEWHNKDGPAPQGSMHLHFQQKRQNFEEQNLHILQRRQRGAVFDTTSSHTQYSLEDSPQTA